MKARRAAVLLCISVLALAAAAVALKPDVLPSAASAGVAGWVGSSLQGMTNGSLGSEEASGWGWRYGSRKKLETTLKEVSDPA